MFVLARVLLFEFAGLFGVWGSGIRAYNVEEVGCIGGMGGYCGQGVVPGCVVFLRRVVLPGEGVGAVEGSQRVGVVLLEKLSDAEVEKR